MHESVFDHVLSLKWPSLRFLRTLTCVVELGSGLERIYVAEVI